MKISLFYSLMLTTLLVLGTTTVASSTPVEDEPTYVYLTWISDPAHTINVNWRTDESYVGEVRYDTESRNGAPEAYSYTTEGTGGVTTLKFEGYIHHVKLTELEPDTTYYFICGNPDYGWSEELSFRTAPVEKKDVRFVVGGDSRWDARPDYPHPDWPEARDDITKLMASYNPDFAIFVGDYIWSGEYEESNLFNYTLKNYPDTWDNWLGAWYKYARTESGRLIPIIPVIGNHEIVYPEPSVYQPMTQASNYYMLFDLPVEENRYAWYSLNWGPDLHIIVLDSEIRWAGSDAWNKQLEWLMQDLLESADNLWKIALFHRPVFSGSSYDHNFKGYWVPEFDLYHLDLCINAHIHDYERTYPLNFYLSEENYQPSPENGTIYIISGGWGAPLGGWGAGWWTAYGADARYHFILADIHENNMLHLKAVDLDSEVFDDLIIQKGVPPQPEGGEVPILLVGTTIVVVVCAIAIFLYLRS